MFEITEKFKVECENFGCDFECVDHEDRTDAVICGLTHEVHCPKLSDTEHLIMVNTFQRRLTEHGIQPAGG
jgi:hypothetical protein